MTTIEELNAATARFTQAVTDYNEAVRAYERRGNLFAVDRRAIAASALSILGLKPLKVRAMLAKVRVVVTYPAPAKPEPQLTFAEPAACSPGQAAAVGPGVVESPGAGADLRATEEDLLDIPGPLRRAEGETHRLTIGGGGLVATTKVEER